MNFTAFNIESCGNCVCDYLTIKDGDGTTLMGKNCGASIPTEILSRTNKVEIYFETNGGGTRTGWSVRWNAVALAEAVTATARK